MKRELLESIVRDLKELDAVKQDSFFSDTLNNIELTTAKKAFKIAVVGEFSTGKSTFINAMIGRDLLSHATQEVTATITNIHNVPRSDKRYRTCDVTCNDGSVIHLKDDRKLVEYTTTQSRVGTWSRTSGMWITTRILWRRARMWSLWTRPG